MSDNSCTCETCKNACRIKPGWFMPGEIEKIAEHLRIPLQELFDTKLGIDWWEWDENIFLVAPAIKGMDAGEEYPADPAGECIFFEDERCTIYPVRPFECRQYLHSDNSKDTYSRHKQVAEAWKDHKDQITALLRREPEAKEKDYGIFGPLFR